MAFFKLNIYDINDSVERHVRYSNGLKEHTNLMYNSLVNIDSCWKDMNTTSFISRVKQDCYKLDDYIRYLDKIYKELSYFSDSVKNVCGKYGYKNVRVIKYNDSRLSDCTRYLNQAIEILNNNLRRLKSLTQDVQYMSLSSVYEKISQINKIIELLENLKEDLVDFSSSINVCLSDARVRKGKIEKIDLGITLVSYGWNVTESDVKASSAEVSQNVVVSGASINLSNENSSVAVNVQQTGVDSQQVKVDNNKGFNLGYNEVAYGIQNNTDINYEYNNSGMDINSNGYVMPNSQSIRQVDRVAQLNSPVNYMSSGVNVNNISSSNMQNPTLRQYNYSQPVGNNVNINNNNNNVNLNVNNYGNVSTGGMNFSTASNNVDVSVSTYNTPTSTSIGNVGNK